MLTTILIILVVIIAAVLIYAATRPNDFVVTRSASIKASAEAIFPLINDFRRWPEWSPFEKLDPQMRRTLSGPDSGKGAAYAWEGNSKAGKGRMEITNSAPSSQVALKLDFEKPFRANNIVDFTLSPSGRIEVDIPQADIGIQIIAKLMGLFMNFDALIGKDFEAGLDNLRRLAER